MTKTTFRIDIGDWSGDGHGQSESYIVDANKSIEEVREAYFKACKNLPDILCPENFCDGYEESEVPEDVIEAAIKAKAPYLSDLKGQEYQDFGPQEMCNYVIWFIKQGDSELELNRREDIDTLAFYGADSKKRHIGFIGYGLLGG